MMKHVTMLSILLLFNFFKTSAETQGKPNDHTHDIEQLAQMAPGDFDTTDHLALQTFATIVGNFFSIAQKPHDREVVVGSIGSIAQNIIHFVSQALAKRTILSETEHYLYVIHLKESLTHELIKTLNATNI